MPESSSSLSREWNSTAYHHLSEPQLAWGRKVLSRLDLRGDETILDAGCGTGRLTALLLQRIPQGKVVAADLSFNMLATARSTLHSEFGQRIRFVATDLQNLPFERAFDGIFSTAVFHWIVDHNRLFRSLHCALRPDGWLFAQCGGGTNLERLRDRVNRLSSQSPYAAHLAGYRDSWFYAYPEETAQRLHSAGFADVQTNLEPAPTQLKDAEQYAAFIENVILHRRLAQIATPVLRHEFVQELTCQAAQDNPPFTLDYWRLNLSARVTS